MHAFQPKRILCPIDFSDHSAAALRVGSGIARAFQAELIALHAQRLAAPVYFTAAQLAVLQAQLRKSAKAAQAFINEFVRKNVPEDVRHSIRLLEDDAVPAILRLLKESRAGLVVMGTHGRTGLERIRLGSVMESVLRQVSVPVLTVGPRIKAASIPRTFRRILCPVNYGDAARFALEHAVAIAEKTGAELIVAHAVEAAATDNPPEEAREKLCDWIGPAVRSRCVVREVVRHGHAAQELVAEMKDSGADLAVVSARPRKFLEIILFGSTTEFVIRNAPCPVLSVIRKEPR